MGSRCVHLRVGRNRKKFKLHASQTASESSTIAEEIVVLLRRLHPLPAWNPLINHYISHSLQTIPKLIAQTTEDAGSLSRREQQVCLAEITRIKVISLLPGPKLFCMQ